jgi:hypothetical protein
VLRISNFAISQRGARFIKLVINMPICVERVLVLPVLLYRRLRYGYAFRRIRLTKGKFAIVDPEDYERLNKYKWHVTKNCNTLYAKRNAPFRTKGPGIPIYMHLEIIKVPPGMVADHINHNGLDNRKANVRPATRAQNNRHTRRIRKTGSSRYKGVSWYSREKRWVAKICTDGKTTTIGYFQDELAAAKAYDQAAKKYHGEFAGLNFPDA